MLLTVVLEKTFEIPLDCKEIQPVHPKGVQSWVFIGRTDVEAETLILWPPDTKSWVIGKDPDAGKDWRQEEKGTTEDEMVGWQHRLSGHEFEQTPRDNEGQQSLGKCNPWSHRFRHDWATEPQLMSGYHLSENLIIKMVALSIGILNLEGLIHSHTWEPLV